MRNLPLLPVIAVVALSTLPLGGCATSMLEPKLDLAPIVGFDLVDPGKVDKDKYGADYKACAALANQDNPEWTRAAAGVVGGLAEKASFGLTGGSTTKFADRVYVLRQCLIGRGYHMLR